MESSETYKNGVVDSLLINNERVKLISIHMLKDLKPINNEEFGYY